MLVLFIILLLILLMILLLNRKAQTTTPIIEPTGTITITPIANPSIVATLDPDRPLATPPDQTGGVDHQFTDEEQDTIDQERGLKRRLPYVTNDFDLRYNYDTDRFEVRLIGTRETFTQWLTTNYPAIDINRFTFL